MMLSDQAAAKELEAGSLESDLLQMVMAKEKLDLFMKGQDTDLDQIYEKFGVDHDLLHVFETHMELHIAFNPKSLLDGVEYQSNNDNSNMLQSFIQGHLVLYGIVLDPGWSYGPVFIWAVSNWNDLIKQWG